MCRKFFVWACIVMAFGAGLLLSLCLESVTLRLALGVGAMLGGCRLLKR